MNRIYTKNEVKKIFSKANYISWGLFFLIISFAPYTALTAHRCFSMETINIICTTFAVMSILIGGTLLAWGIYCYLQNKKLTKNQLHVSNEVYIWVEREKEKAVLSLFISIGLCIVLFSLGTLCVMTSSGLYRTQSAYVLAGYTGIFVFFGAGFCIVVNGVIRFLLLKGINCTVLTEDSLDETVKKRSMVKIIIASMVVFVVITIIMFKGTWYIQPYIATIPYVPHRQLEMSYNEENGIYTMKNPEEGDFKILQLTDIHLGGSFLSYQKDLKALQTVYELIDKTRPDFIIVTGDFVFPLGIESYSFNNYTPMMQFCSFMRNIGIPWAMTYGNHDTEFVASHSEEELNDLFKQFDYNHTRTLLYADVQPDVYGRANQMILLKNKDDSINQVFYLIDSNSYTGKGINDYDYIHEDQVKWYADSIMNICEKEGRVVPSMIFTHIPLQQYETAYNLYKNHDTSVIYYYGEVGEKNEAICYSDYPSSLFEKAVEIGSTKGIFCGHDHYNNISMEYQNIRLTYGMSIDYLAMPGIEKCTKQRGATTILIHQDGSFDVEPVPYSKGENE